MIAGRSLVAVVVCAAIFSGQSTARGDGFSPELQRAVRLFELSATRYNEGKFEEAVRLLREAYQLNPTPTMQYNLGRALEGLGDTGGAIVAYKAYLASEARISDRQAIEQRIATLTRSVEEREALRREREEALRKLEVAEIRVAPGERAVAPKLPPSRARRAAPWVVLASGVVLLAVAGGLGGLSLDRQRRVDQIATARDAEDDASAAERFALGANVSFGIGGGLALAGGVWGIVEAVGARRARVGAP